MFTFHNVGKEIKAWIKFVWIITFAPFALGAVALLIFGIVVLSHSGSDGEAALGAVLMIVSIGVFIWGYAVSRLLVMYHYGYGELIENSATIAGFEKYLKGEKTKNQAAEKNTESVKDTIPTWQKIEMEKKYVSEIVIPNSVDSMRFQCTKCQTIQMRNRESCSHCGAQFKKQ